METLSLLCNQRLRFCPYWAQLRVVTAERAGFEPAIPFGTHALQACALGRTMRPLRLPSVFGGRDYTTHAASVGRSKKAGRITIASCIFANYKPGLNLFPFLTTIE